MGGTRCIGQGMVGGMAACAISCDMASSCSKTHQWVKVPVCPCIRQMLRSHRLCQGQGRGGHAQSPHKVLYPSIQSVQLRCCGAIIEERTGEGEVRTWSLCRLCACTVCLRVANHRQGIRQRRLTSRYTCLTRQRTDRQDKNNKPLRALLRALLRAIPNDYRTV